MEYYQGRTIWFTGLSGSGKSTLSSMLKSLLEARGVPVVLLDGDVLRKGLNRDLGFSALDRAENIRRAAEVAKILSDAGHTVIAAFITPLESLRTAVRGIFEPGRYVEIFLDCPLSVCEERDAKGLYARARSGQIPEFTGVSSPFEAPTTAEVVVQTDRQGLEESLAAVVGFLEDRFPDVRNHAPCQIYGASASRGRRVAVIGIDGATPELVFGEAGLSLHNLRALMKYGVWGPLQPTDSSSRFTKWASVITGRGRTALGLLDGIDRADALVPDNGPLSAPCVWDYIEECGRTAMLLNVPFTYPPAARRGLTIAGPPMPADAASLTYPAALAPEIHKLAGGTYRTDVDGDHDPGKLLQQLHRMSDGRFGVAGHLLRHEPWDLFMMTETAAAKIQQLCCGCGIAGGPPDDNGCFSERVFIDFWQRLDGWIGSLMAQLCDETTVMVISAHSAATPDGIFIMTRLSDLRRFARRGRRIEGTSLLDLTPTILHEFGLTVPSGVGGKIISVDEPENKHVVLSGACGGTDTGSRGSRGCSPEEGDVIRRRLGRLGYL